MKKLLVLVFAIALCLGVLCVGASAADIQPNEPEQDSSGVYQIGTAEELYWFAGLVNGTLTDGTAQNTAAHAKLTNNITINTGVLAAIASGRTPTYTWTPIGTDYNKAYTGTFDGNDKTISGLYYSGSGNYVGLFGCVGSGGRVQNVNVADSYINVNVSDMVNVYVGGVCGYNYGTITNCSFAGSVTGTGTGSGISTCVGGVSGYNNSGTITNCRNTGSVTSSVNGNNYVGGVSGNNYSGTITNCYNTGSVTGTGTVNYVGGVCAANSGMIMNCYNTDSVTGSGTVAYVGGVCGHNSGTITNCYNTGTITNCYNTGTVNGSHYTGGVCGYNAATIMNCYNTGSVNGSGNYTGGVCGNNYSGTITNCYWQSGTADEADASAKTEDQFASGEVAWLLNKGQANGPWRQSIGTDDYPVLGAAQIDTIVHKKVDGGYENSGHYFGGNGFCTKPDCSACQPAELDDGVYQIGKAGQLYWFAEKVNGGEYDADAVLMTDITINTGVLGADGSLNVDGSSFTQWTPIGNNSTNAYTGTFNGDGHTISGLYYSGSSNYVGLFGYVGSGGQVKNVNVADSYISVNVRDRVNVYVGGVCGWNYGTITNCYNTGSVTGSGTVAYVGGVCGYNSGTIMNCYNTGSVTGTNDRAYAGGVCGNNYSGTITNCYNTGTVTGTGNVGGVSGNNNRGTITNCYWQSGTADGNVGRNNGTVTNVKSKSTTEFASGEVTWLLNSDQENGPWRQNLSDERDDYPVLDSTHNQVVQLTVDSTVSYLNKGDSFSGVEGIGYYLDGEMVELPYTVEADTVLTTKTLYVVTVDGVVSYVDPNEPVFKLPAAPSRSGYTFVGWSDGSKTYEAGDGVTITTDTTFTAVWKQLFTVTVVYDNGTADTKEQVVDGDSFKLPETPSKSGYYFVGWSDGNTTYKAGAMVENITADTTFTAVWREINIPTPNSITVTQPANGSIKVNPSNGSAGTLITVTATPDEGYELAYITVDGERITGNTFRMPDKAVTVSAVFVPATFPFVDVKTGDWFYDYVAYVYSNGLMDGTSATTFEPNANMTRAMVWAILARIDGETVTGAAWATDARAWAMAEGVSDGTDPNGLVTREQFATMLWRYAGEPDSDYPLSAFTDAANVSDYAATAMAWAVEHGIISGVTDTTLVPQGTATRAQCAAMLMRFTEL